MLTNLFALCGFVVQQPALLALVLMSVLALGLGCERVFFILRQRRGLRRGRERILAHLRDGKPTMAQALNESLPKHAATPLLAHLLDNGGPTRQLARMHSRVIRQAKRRLWVLGSVASVAPFVGLLGTVLGVMHAFADMGTQTAGGLGVVSAGLSEALTTTAAGIFVGVEAVVLFNYLKTCVADYAADLREGVDEISEQLSGGGRVAPEP